MIGKRRMGRPSLPLILDQSPGGSAAACLAMILGYHGKPTPIESLRSRMVPVSEGDLADALATAANLLQLEGEWQRATLTELRCPAVLAWKGGRFTVLSSADRGRIEVHDPREGLIRLSHEDAAELYRGSALLLSPSPEFGGDVRPMSLVEVIGPARGLRWIASKALLLSLLMQIFVLASPYLIQVTFDRAVPLSYSILPLLFAAAFGLLTLLGVLTDWLRALVLTSLTTTLHRQIVGRLFEHFVRLPFSWFETRQEGEIAARFSSGVKVKDLFAQELTAAAVDGIMMILTLIMMTLYSPLLAAIAFSMHLTLLIVRKYSAPALVTRENEYWRASASENSHFLETTRSILSIKSLAEEGRRERLWRQRLDIVADKHDALQRLKARMRAVEGVIIGLENAASVFCGAMLVMSNALSLGMLMAFIAYKRNFSSCALRLHHAGERFHTLDLDLHRISDIVREPTEPLVRQGASSHILSGRIELQGVGFRYDNSNHPVLEAADMVIEAGEFIAITGPSGCGKSTFVKLVLGFFQPSHGQILFDGCSASAFGLSAFRRQLGVVLQDDMMVSGTIAENISFFDEAPDHAWLRECAAIAGIHDEIQARALGYDSDIVDHLTGLSGGQRQRLILARALYRRPRILLLDECTSQLDVAKERQICAAIARLPMTRVMISHRPETIAAADRVLTLRERRLVEIAPAEASDAQSPGIAPAAARRTG